MIRFILSILITYRLSQLIAWDSGPMFVIEELRSKVKELSDDDWEKRKIKDRSPKRGSWQSLDEGINCPYCLGMYFSLFCVILFIKPPKKDLLLYWLGVAGGQAFLQGLTKGR